MAKEEEENLGETWEPKTRLGRKVKTGEITEIDEILDKGLPIREQEIVDMLLPEIEEEFILIGQAKGKFGGGQRRLYKATIKKTAEGNVMKFIAMAVVGNRDGYVGVGLGASKETVPAREKATRNAKKNLIRVKRGCGSWECGCEEPHSIPFETEGRTGSVRVKLKPAPKGIGLCIAEPCKTLLKLAGIEDVWSKTLGQTGTRVNLIKACFNALKNLSKTKTERKSKKITVGEAE